MQKNARQLKLAEIVETKKVSRQAELVKLLARLGFDVTQTSVSRDLLELGISKINGIYAVKERTDTEDIFGVQSLESAGDNLIVIKCGIGMASAAALRIDNAQIENVAGTIAGDDTLFVAIQDDGSRNAVRSAIEKLFKNG